MCRMVEVVRLVPVPKLVAGARLVSSMMLPKSAMMTRELPLSVGLVPVMPMLIPALTRELLTPSLKACALWLLLTGVLWSVPIIEA